MDGGVFLCTNWTVHLRSMKMELYCRVVDGVVVVLPRGLPKTFENISGFHGMPDSGKRSLGWYPVDQVQPDINPVIQNQEGPFYDIGPERVQMFWTVTDKPLPEVKTYLVKQLRSKAGDLILSKYPEYTQRNLIAKGLTLTNKKITTPLDEGEQTLEAQLFATWEWVDSVRGTCNDNEALVMAANTNTEALNVYNNVVWPT